MDSYGWSVEKDLWLIANRGVSFQELLAAIEEGDLLAIEEHPNPASYPGQRVLVVKMNDYAYAVPFVEDGGRRFLKTAFPSRMLTRRYLRTSE